MTEFYFNGLQYNVSSDGIVYYLNGRSWFPSALGSIKDITSISQKPTHDLWWMSKKFLVEYNKVAVKHPSEVF